MDEQIQLNMTFQDIPNTLKRKTFRVFRDNNFEETVQRLYPHWKAYLLELLEEDKRMEEVGFFKEVNQQA